MAFNLFKKNNFADVIYKNAHIFTNDLNFPWAEAVACKDGLILAVGEFDAMNHLIGDLTEIIDLDSQFMFPGFINIHSFPVLKIFEDKYFKIESEWDFTTILDNLTEYINTSETSENFSLSLESNGKDVYFGYGFNKSSIDDIDKDELIARLDNISSDAPILLMSESGLNCIYNSITRSIISETAENECVPYITAEYIANIFTPFDYDELENSTKVILNEYSDKGFTSIFNLASVNYFDEIFQNILLSLVTESHIPLRFFGSLFLSKPLDSNFIIHKLLELKTNCVEINNKINYNTLNLLINSDALDENELREIFNNVSDNGFNIFADCKDSITTQCVSKIFMDLREKGVKNNVFTLASDFPTNLNDEVTDIFIQTFATNIYNESVLSNLDTVEDLISLYTEKSAAILGMSKDLGSIEKGKNADFTLFDENILSYTLNKFSKTTSSMTIIDGEIVHDANEEAMEELFDLLSSQQL